MQRIHRNSMMTNADKMIVVTVLLALLSPCCLTQQHSFGEYTSAMPMDYWSCSTTKNWSVSGLLVPVIEQPQDVSFVIYR